MFDNNWNQKHKKLWESSLEINNEGLSYFQVNLTELINIILNTFSLKYEVEITEHIENNSNNKTFKMLTFKFLEKADSKIWVYNNMADFEIDGKHCVFEEWGYLSPKELETQFIRNLKNILSKSL